MARTKLGQKIRDDLSMVIRDVMLLAESNLINSTPVDTTHAANNWILSTGRPYSGIDGSREHPSHAVQDAQREAFRSYDVGRDGKAFVGNNVFYVQFLDKGWSQQADADFVADAMMAAMRKAPHGRKMAVRKMLRGLAAHAYTKGY